jgi:hypothetical protein
MTTQIIGTIKTPLNGSTGSGQMIDKRLGQMVEIFWGNTAFSIDRFPLGQKTVPQGVDQGPGRVLRKAEHSGNAQGIFKGGVPRPVLSNAKGQLNQLHQAVPGIFDRIQTQRTPTGYRHEPSDIRRAPTGRPEK